MTTMREVDAFLAFLREVFVEREVCGTVVEGSVVSNSDRDSAVAMHSAAMGT
jgi:hypothetical protein